MELTDDQKTKVKQWVKEGCGLSEIQKRLREECNLALTFMEVRLLVLDLGVALKEKAQPSPLPDLSKAKGARAPSPADAGELDAETPAGGGVTVDLDRVMKPGALASGTVRFSDGVAGAWSLDQFGRLGLNISRKGYRPSPEDLQAFQQELASLIQSRGM